MWIFRITVTQTERNQGAWFAPEEQRSGCLQGFMVQGSGFQVQGSGFRVQGSGFKFEGLGRKTEGFVCASIVRAQQTEGFWFRV